MHIKIHKLFHGFHAHIPQTFLGASDQLSALPQQLKFVEGRLRVLVQRDTGGALLEAGACMPEVEW